MPHPLHLLLLLLHSCWSSDSIRIHDIARKATKCLHCVCVDGGKYVWPVLLWMLSPHLSPVFWLLRRPHISTWSDHAGVIIVIRPGVFCGCTVVDFGSELQDSFESHMAANFQQSSTKLVQIRPRVLIHTMTTLNLFNGCKINQNCMCVDDWMRC